MKATALALVLLVLAGTVQARNTKVLVPLVPALRAAQRTMGTDVSLRFGKASASGIEATGVVEAHAVVDPYGAPTVGMGHRWRRTDEQACDDAFRKAVVDLQQRARAAGANAVVGIVSDYEKTEFDSSESFECHVGMTRVVVDLRGSTARIGPVPGAPPAARAEPAGSGFADVADVDAVPYIGDKGRERYALWLTWAAPKAFAISPSGSWFSSQGYAPGDASLPTDPIERAVIGCSRASPTPCRLYAVNGSVVWVKP
jgi:uncharacterized protein YbjQ (UPF0145 family)